MIGILNVGLPLTIDGLKKNTVSASAVKQGIMWKVLALMLDSSTNANSSTNARTFHMIYNKAKMDCNPPGSSVRGFSRQEHWSGLPCPPPGHLPHPRTEPESLVCPALAGRFLTTSATWQAHCCDYVTVIRFDIIVS